MIKAMDLSNDLLSPGCTLWKLPMLEWAHVVLGCARTFVNAPRLGGETRDLRAGV